MFETPQEKRDFVIVAVVLGFIFGFDDGSQVFDFGFWALNLLKMIVFSGIAVFIHQLGHVFIAGRHGAVISFRLWTMKRFGIKTRQAKAHLPVGIIISIILALFSTGQIPFAALWSNEVSIDKRYRLGRKFTNLTDIETAKIYMAGPIISVIFALLFKSFSSSIPSLQALSTISFVIAICTLIPFPTLAGNHLVFTSLSLWISSLAFVIISYLASIWLSSMLSFIIALFLMVLAGIIHVYYKHK